MSLPATSPHIFVAILIAVLLLLLICCGHCLRKHRDSSELLLAGATWGFCSVFMTLLNKVALQLTDAPLSVLIVQMAATCVVCLCRYKTLRFGAGTKLWATRVPPLFVAMLATSMFSLKFVSVGCFVIVRNLGPLVTLVLELAWHRPDQLSCNVSTVGAMVAILAGVVIYEANDLKLSFVGGA